MSRTPTPLPADSEPVFDTDLDDLPWPQGDALPMDDDGNVMPGTDADDNPLNDYGLRPEPGGTSTALDATVIDNS